MLKNLVAILWVFMLPLCVFGQKKNYVLHGVMHIKDGKSFPYQLMLTVTGNNLAGYATTKLTDGTEPRTTVTGTVNRKLHTLSLTERPYAEKQKALPITCFAATKLYYKPGKKYAYHGDFKAADTEGMFCGEGTIELEQPDMVNNIFSDDSVKVAQATAVEEVPDHGDEFEITSGVTRHFEWVTDTCVLEMFDGGIVDGDEVTLIFNNKVILNDYALTKQKKQVKLPLTQKNNTVTIVAEYEGRVPPNTANIILYDKNKQYKIKAFNNAGDKATITINRK